MRVSHVFLFALLAPVVTVAFLPNSLKSNPTQISLRSPRSGENVAADGFASLWQADHCSFTQLNMAFREDEPSNIFDGPMALTKERDACGVGFIANTKAGGKVLLVVHNARPRLDPAFELTGNDFSPFLQANSVVTKLFRRAFPH